MMRRLAKLAGWLLVACFVSSLLAAVAYRWLPVGVTPLMVIRSVQNWDHGPAGWHHEWVSIEDMSPYMPVAVMASEDQNFLHHNGFDYEAILRAQKEFEEGGRRRGASTISQQTAKNVFLWPNSTWLRKGLEVYFTVLIEKLWSKQRIMEVYLNSIEMGKDVYGIEAVAETHFNTTAGRMTRANCALVAATLPNPRKMDSGHPSRYVLKRRHAIERQMKHIDFMDLQ